MAIRIFEVFGITYTRAKLHVTEFLCLLLSLLRWMLLRWVIKHSNVAVWSELHDMIKYRQVRGNIWPKMRSCQSDL